MQEWGKVPFCRVASSLRAGPPTDWKTLQPKVRRPNSVSEKLGWHGRIKQMRRALFILAVAVLSATAAVAGDESQSTAAPVTCGNGVPGGINCIATKKDLKEARDAYAR